jgi:hypothetical protein
MLNFLPQKNKNQIIFDYILRVLSVFLIFSLISSLLLSALFIPSYFFVNLKNNNFKNQLQLIKEKIAYKGEDPILYIKNINRFSIALSDDTKIDVNYSDLIGKIVDLKNKSIQISSIDITDNEKESGKQILLGGNAITRDGLTLYEKELKTDGFFNSVIFPVSNFLQSTNSQFTATLIYQYK